jgi:hypothetical protein
MKFKGKIFLNFWRLNPYSAGSKELLNNFKILTRQEICESLPYSRACTKSSPFNFSASKTRSPQKALN